MNVQHVTLASLRCHICLVPHPCQLDQILTTLTRGIQSKSLFRIRVSKGGALEP